MDMITLAMALGAVQQIKRDLAEGAIKGEPGDDYVLTNQDKIDIANIVLSELPTVQGVLYGNTSN